MPFSPRPLALATLLAATSPASADAPLDRPRLHLLAVAVEDYEDPDIPDLRFTIDDAEALKWWAEQQAGHLYDDQVIATTLTGEEATRAGIIRRVQEMVRGARPGDQLVLFLGGHGIVDPVDGRYHLLPVNVEFDPDNPTSESISSTGLSEDELRAQLRRSGQDPDRLTLLFDTCQSGKLVETSGDRSLFAANAPKLIPGQAAAQALSVDQPTARLQLAASGAHQLAGEISYTEGAERCAPNEPEGIEGHGYFTCALLRGLTGEFRPNTGHPDLITINMIKDWVELDTPRLNIRWPQQVSSRLDASGGGGYLAFGWIPGSSERCDNHDNDLDGATDEGFPDQDQNGRADCIEAERCNGRDDDSDGQTDEGMDADGDGYLPISCADFRGADCDDNDQSVHPGAVDWANHRDEDCDGALDENSSLGVSGLPLTVERSRLQGRRKMALGIGTTAASVALATAAFYNLQRLSSMQDQDSPDPLISPYQWSSTGVYLFGAASVVGAGVSVRFGLDNIDYRHEVVLPTTRVISAQEGRP